MYSQIKSFPRKKHFRLSAQQIISTQLPSHRENLMSGRAPNIIKDSSQPENHLFTLLSSGGATVLLKPVPPDFKKLVLLPCAIFYIYYISGVIYLVKSNTMLLSFIFDQVWFTFITVLTLQWNFVVYCAISQKSSIWTWAVSPLTESLSTVTKASF